MTRSLRDDDFRLSVQTPKRNKLAVTLTSETYKQVYKWVALVVAGLTGLGGLGVYLQRHANVNQTTIHMQSSPPVGVGKQKK